MIGRRYGVDTVKHQSLKEFVDFDWGIRPTQNLAILCDYLDYHFRLLTPKAHSRHQRRANQAVFGLFVDRIEPEYDISLINNVIGTLANTNEGRAEWA
ncbi:MAG: hypothetical protein CMJ19_13265 [Phycisphaeraceae bacterium]|nr:hypothetical protein [Phycisphaeraceae bacterium]